MSCRLCPRLSIGLAAGKISYCTASLIADDLVLTNHHCIPGAGNVQEVMLWMGYLRPSSMRGVAQYPVNSVPFEANKKLDYAILRVRVNPGRVWGTVRLSTARPEPGQSLFIIHHPAGMTKHITRGGCQADDPAVVADNLMHMCDTLPGSSGAPVFDNNSRTVVGLHNRAAGPRVNAGKQIASIAENSTLIGRLVRRNKSIPISSSTAAPASPAATAWKIIQNSSSTAVIKAFVQQYPDSVFATFARARLAEIQQQRSSSMDALPVRKKPANITNRSRSKSTRKKVAAKPKKKRKLPASCYVQTIGHWGADCDMGRHYGGE
ncbi:MAG: trypsin-like serine peptidase [Hyphomicrobiaceae bacterium]